jgi:hypothetical protein
MEQYPLLGSMLSNNFGVGLMVVLLGEMSTSAKQNVVQKERIDLESTHDPRVLATGVYEVPGTPVHLDRGFTDRRRSGGGLIDEARDRIDTTNIGEIRSRHRGSPRYSQRPRNGRQTNSSTIILFENQRLLSRPRRRSSSGFSTAGEDAPGENRTSGPARTATSVR